jgi:hypothetical protein
MPETAYVGPPSRYVLFDGYALYRPRLSTTIVLGKLGIHGGVAQW